MNQKPQLLTTLLQRSRSLSGWARRHPVTTAATLFLLWIGVLAVHGKLTEHDRFDASFRTAVWEWHQLGGDAQPMGAEERQKLIAQLYSREPPERWKAARKLGSWREPAALWPLITAMEDAAGTQRTCLISQALGKLGKAAAVPALIEAAQHRSNADLRVCATHSLGQIGDDRAVSFLVSRVLDSSLSEGDRTVAISALGEIGSPLALPTLQEIAASNQRAALRSFAASAIRQIELLEAKAETNLLTALGDNSEWIQDDWILMQLHRRWSGQIAAELNEILRTRVNIPSGLRFHITALLSAKQALEKSTLDSLACSSNHANQWLAILAQLADVRIAASE